MNETETRPGRIIKREDQEENQLGFAIIGKIKIGKKNEKGYPESLDHFRATGNHAEQFYKALGPEPKKIRIVFPSPFPEVCCYQRIEGRDSEGNLAAVSDGLNHRLWSDKVKDYIPATNQELEDAKTKGIPVTKGYGQNAKTTMILVKNWVERLTLRFIVLEMKGILGVWELSTNGIASSIPNIIGNFDRMADSAGRNMNKVVFDLSVDFAKGQKPGSMSRYPVLTLVPNLSYESAMMLNDFKNNDTIYNQLITDDTIGKLMNGGDVNEKQLPEAQIKDVTIVPEPVVADIADPIIVEQKAETTTPVTVQVNAQDTKKSKPKSKGEPFEPEKLRDWVKAGILVNKNNINSETADKLEYALLAVTNYNQSDVALILEYLTKVIKTVEVSQGEAERIILWVDVVEDDNGDYIPKDLNRITQAQQILSVIRFEVEGKLL